MTSPAERDTRVADAAEAWLADPMRKSLYSELVSAVRFRSAARTPPATRAEPAPTGTARVSVAAAPKQHRNPDFLAAKKFRLYDEHVAPVQTLVDEIRRHRETESVPYVDPDSGGVRAKVLLRPGVAGRASRTRERHALARQG